MLQLVKNKQETCKILTETHKSNIITREKKEREKIINSKNNTEKNGKNMNEKIDENYHNTS